MVLLLLLLLLLLRGNRGGGESFYFFYVFLERGGDWGRIGGEYSGMVDRLVVSDLVCYLLGDRGCALLLVLFFFVRDISFENLLGAFIVFFPIC